jgi:Protein of unknown function (DUF3043)
VSGRRSAGEPPPPPGATRRAAPTARERRESERRDRGLAPYDRGPLRAFIRDEVDARRRIVGAFLPVLGIVVISALSPASDWQRYALYAGLAALAVVLVDAALMAVVLTRAARSAFPDEPVPLLATGWYAFRRAHRSRSVRRPPPRVAPRGRPVPRAR